MTENERFNRSIYTLRKAKKVFLITGAIMVAVCIYCLVTDKNFTFLHFLLGTPFAVLIVGSYVTAFCIGKDNFYVSGLWSEPNDGWKSTRQGVVYESESIEGTALRLGFAFTAGVVVGFKRLVESIYTYMTLKTQMQ